MEKRYTDKMGEKLKVSVSIVLVGTSEGVKNHGGVLQQTMRELEVECLPSKIPEQIEVDVTEMQINDALHVSDIELEDAEILADESAVVATVSPPRVIEEEEVETEGEEGEEESAEPEVLSQKSEDEE